MNRKIVVRLLAVLLIVVGSIGCLGGFLGAYFLWKSDFYNRLVSFETNTIEELTAMSTALHHMNTTSANAALTLKEGKATLENSAANLNYTAKMFKKLSLLMDFEIPLTNEKPLSKATSYFTDIGAKSEDFSSHLMLLSSYIGDDSGDVGTLASDFVIVANNLDEVRLSLEQLHISSMFKIIVYIMAWVGLLHLTFVIIGVALLCT